jgi:hypothetical protein
MFQASLIAPANADQGNNVMIRVDQNNDREFIAGNFTLKTPSGQVPFYFYWDNNDADSTYRVQFSSLFEATDTNGDNTFDNTDTRIAGSVMSLSSLDWTFSDVVNETNANNEVTTIHFNITGSEKNTQTDSFYIQFRNHIDVASEKNELKFDIVINNYEWNDDSAILVLGYKIQSTHPNYNGETNQNGNTVRFGDGYFESNSTANDDNSTITSGLSTGSETGENNPFIYVSYEHFDGEMIHDPTIGVQAASVNPDSENNAVGSIDLFLIGALAVIAPVALRRFRR